MGLCLGVTWIVRVGIVLRIVVELGLYLGITCLEELWGWGCWKVLISEQCLLVPMVLFSWIDVMCVLICWIVWDRMVLLKCHNGVEARGVHSGCETLWVRGFTVASLCSPHWRRICSYSLDVLGFLILMASFLLKVALDWAWLLKSWYSTQNYATGLGLAFKIMVLRIMPLDWAWLSQSRWCSVNFKQLSIEH